MVRSHPSETLKPEPVEQLLRVATSNEPQPSLAPNLLTAFRRSVVVDLSPNVFLELRTAMRAAPRFSCGCESQKARKVKECAS
jgi:hypothetical protein